MRRSRLVLTGALVLGSGAALAQSVDARRPLILRVGPPEGASPTDRGDAQRRGLTRETLPAGALHIAWQRPLGQAVESAPLALAGGDIAVVAGRSDVVRLASDGTERWRTSLGVAVAGGPTSTSDGTLVVMASSGEVVGIRADGAVRFRNRIGDRGTFSRAAPLPLDDGGAVVATGNELLTIDAEGAPRARVTLPEPVACSPIAAGGKVLAITTSGATFAWTPGRDAQRVGSFGGIVDGGAALVDPSTLVAIVDATRMVALDLTRGTATTRSQAGPALYLGPPAVARDRIALLGMAPGRTFLVGLRPTGEEIHRIALPASPVPLSADGGAGALLLPPHVGPVADLFGAVAFATPNGHVGVVSAQGATEILGELPCARAWGAKGETSGSNGGIVGLIPTGRAGLLIACDSGTLVKVTGS